MASRERSAPHVAAALCWAVFSFAPSKVLAQMPDLLGVGAQYMPPAKLQGRGPTSAQVTSYDASLNVPLPLGSRTFLIPGLAYHFDSVSYSNTPPDFTQLRAFHSLEAPLLVVQLLPNDWALSFRAAPGLAGDFRRFDGGLFHLSAVALASRSFSERFALGGGAVATYSFGSLLFLPAVSVEWKPIDGLVVQGFVPVFMSAKYTFSSRVELGVRGDIAGNSYAIRDSRVADAWPCVAGARDNPATSANEDVANPTECIDHVAYSVGAVGAVVGVRLFESVWWTAFAGTSVFRRLDQQNDRDEPITGGKQTIPNVFFARIGLVWRIPSDQAEKPKSS